MAEFPSIDATNVSLDYAVSAAETGWSNASLRRFLEARGVAADAQRLHWPQGARSAARHLNEVADSEMARRWKAAPSARLSDIVVQRFADNRALRRSVRCLAMSDLVHPFDTLARTAITVDQMMKCRGGYRAASAGGRWRERWALVLAYSALVLIWLADNSPGERNTQASTKWLMRMIGAD
jgi:hypothetical protein